MNTVKRSSIHLGSLGRRSAGLRRGIAVALAGLALVLVLVWCVALLGTPQASLHITQAQLLEQPGRGYLPAPSSPDLPPAAAAPGAWREVALPHARPLPWLIRLAPAPDGAAPTVVSWYRIEVPANAPPRQGTRYIYIPRWKSYGRIAIYGNGRLLYQSQSSQLALGSNHPLLLPWYADAGSANANGAAPGVLLVRIQHLPGLDGALSSVWIGDEDTLGWRYELREWLQAQLPLLSSAAFLAIGLFALLVWLRRRHEVLYLLFAAMSVAAYIRTLQYSVGPDRLLIADAWFAWMTGIARVWLVVLTHLFLVCLHGRHQPWLTRTVVGVGVLLCALTLPWLHPWLSLDVSVPLNNLVLVVTSNVVFIVGLRNAWLSRAYCGVLLAGWGLLSAQLGIYDWLLEKNRIDIEGAFLASYANLGAFSIFAFVMYRRYVGAIDEIEQLNTGLEQRLQVREAELGASYQRLRQVEQREMLNQERRRLMQDMHDGLGASLISALRVVEHGQLNTAEVADILKSCVEDLKLSIDSMEPVEADLLLLLATLRFRIGPRLQSMGVELRWQIQDVPELDWLDPRNSLHILRILQEAFTNIIKHTRASEIRVATAVVDQGVCVTIIDNGQGFSLDHALKQGGRGLANQRSRVEAIGGRVRWESGPGGTTFFLWLPVKRGAASTSSPA